MDKITLDQVEKRYQEYLQLSTLDKLLLRELDNGRLFYKVDPFRLEHAKALENWLDFSNENVIRLTALTDFVMRYDAMLSDSISGIKADIKSINRVIGEYQEKIADLMLKLEMANQALKALESHEDK